MKNNDKTEKEMDEEEEREVGERGRVDRERPPSDSP